MGTFSGWVLKAFDEVCGKKSGWRSKDDTWWWNEVVKEAIIRKMNTRRCAGIILKRIRTAINA